MVKRTSIADILTTDMSKIDRVLDSRVERTKEFCDGALITIWEFEDELNDYEFKFALDMQKRFNCNNYNLTDAQFNVLYDMARKYFDKRAYKSFQSRQDTFRRR